MRAVSYKWKTYKNGKDYVYIRTNLFHTKPPQKNYTGFVDFIANTKLINVFGNAKL
jgi:hypothetical protein